MAAHSILGTQKESTAMRASRICYWIVFVPLLGILGCSNSAYTKKGPELKTSIVTITNCIANPDTAQVHSGDDLTWNIDPSDSHSYSIQFKGHTPFSSSTVPPGQSQKAKGEFWCNTFGGIHGEYCVYRYDLVQDGKTCPDPGVHIVR
jgi:hypothetical protein